MGTKCITLFGEFKRGLSIGLARIGECDRGDIWATRLRRCAEIAALLLDEQPAVVSFLVTTPPPPPPNDAVAVVCPTCVPLVAAFPCSPTAAAATAPS